MAAALLEMVCNLTIGKPAYAEHDETMTSVRDRATSLRSDALGLAQEDAEAFGAVIAAYKLPKETEDEVAPTAPRDPARARRRRRGRPLDRGRRDADPRPGREDRPARQRQRDLRRCRRRRRGPSGDPDLAAEHRRQRRLDLRLRDARDVRAVRGRRRGAPRAAPTRSSRPCAPGLPDDPARRPPAGRGDPRAGGRRSRCRRRAGARGRDRHRRSGRRLVPRLDREGGGGHRDRVARGAACSPTARRFLPASTRSLPTAPSTGSSA